MKLNQVKEPPRPQQPSNDLSPGREIGQIAQGPFPGINHIKGPIPKPLNSVVNIGMDVFNIHPEPPRNRTGVHNGLPRDVKPHHPRPTPSKRNTLHPKMTLKMHKINAVK